MHSAKATVRPPLLELADPPAEEELPPELAGSLPEELLFELPPEQAAERSATKARTAARLATLPHRSLILAFGDSGGRALPLSIFSPHFLYVSALTSAVFG